MSRSDPGEGASPRRARGKSPSPQLSPRKRGEGADRDRRTNKQRMTDLPSLDASVLPTGICARFVDGINGLRMHVLEAGFPSLPVGRTRCCFTAFPSWPIRDGT